MPDDLRDQFPKVREVVKALRIPVYELPGYEADDVIGTLTVDAERRGLDTTIVSGDLDMLQLVTDHTRLMTTRSGRREHDHVRPREDPRAVRPRARPDDRLQGAQGRHDRQHPGRPRGRREDRRQAASGTSGRSTALYERIDEVKPDKLRDKLVEHRDAVFMGKRARRRSSATCRSSSTSRRPASATTTARGHPALPRVRVPDADRAAAGDDRRERRRRGRGAARRRRRTAPCPRRTSPARPGRRAGARRGRSGHRRRAAGSSSASTSTRSRGRRRADGGADASSRRRRRRPAHGAATVRRPGRPADARWPRRSPTRRASRSMPATGSPTLAPWLAAQSAVGVGAPARRPAAAARHAAGARRRRRGRPDHRGRGSGRRRDACAGSLDRPATPLVGHEVKPLLVARIARRPGRAPATPRRASTPRSRPTSSTPRCAASRSPTSCAERLDLDPAAGRRSCAAAARRPRGAVGARRARAARATRSSTTGLDRLYSRAGAAAHPRAGPDGGDRRRHRPRGPGGARARSSRPRSSGSRTEIYRDVGHEFNLGSPKQLEQVLFYELNLPQGKRTKTGYSTDASVLEDLRPAHPMIDKLLDWRIYTKLRSTYVEALPLLLAGRRPPPHDVPPGRGGDRPALVVRPEPPEHPDPDRARAADPARVRGRRPGPDAARRRLQPDRAAHPGPRLGRRAPQGGVRAATPTSTARRPPGCSRRTPPTSPLDERSMAKMVNFGLAYGMSDFGLSRAGRTSRARRRRSSSTRYFAAYSGISYYMIAIRELARDAGLRRDAARAGAADPGAGGAQRVAARRQASGWPSTCPSRAPPRTS